MGAPVAGPRKKSRLSPETQERIDRLHEASVGRLVAAEVIAVELLRRPLERAVEQMVSRMALSGAMTEREARRAAFQAIRDVAGELGRAFEAAAVQGRHHARVLSRAQVQAELAEVTAFLAQLPGADSFLRMPTVEALPDTAEQDGASAQSSGLGMAQRFSALAFGSYVAWRRRPEATVPGLTRQFGRLGELAEPRMRSEAAVLAVDAYADEHRGVWNELAGVPRRQARRPAPGPRLRPPGQLPSGPELGLPYGWGAATFEVWSAILDRKTCPQCFDVDGTMVPIGKEFPGFGRPPIHGGCRCTLVSVFVPEALSSQLPGLEIDYAELKEDVRDYMQGSTVNLGLGLRHSESYIRDVLGEGSPSPVVLTKRLMDRRGYFPGRPQPRAPRVLNIR